MLNGYNPAEHAIKVNWGIFLKFSFASGSVMQKPPASLADVTMR